MPKAIEFDFKDKVDQEIPLDRAKLAIAGGRFVWIDLDGTDVAASREVLKNAVPLDEPTLFQCLALTPDTKYDLRPGCLHLVIVGCRFAETGSRPGALEHDRVDLIVGDGYMVTVHRHTVTFLERVRAHYHEDFLQHAKSPSFLLYEIWDALIDSYEEVEASLEARVEEMQDRVLKSFDDSVFPEFAALGNDLLHLRKLLGPTRNVLDELATRKSRFVSEATQPFLAGMISRVERILQDVTVYREVLSNALSLHVAMGDNKMNKIMQKLTTVSLFFMPLTFITGVYGMNFNYQPEFGWKYGYFLWFWGLVSVILGIVFIITRRMKYL